LVLVELGRSKMELKRRQTADAANSATWRRDVSGVLVFISVFLLGSLIVILIWNFEELQGVLRLLPARESFKDAGDATSVGKPTIEEEVAAGAGIVGAEALKDKKKKQKPENDGIVGGGGGGEANLVEVEPVVVELTILTKAADIGAGTANLVVYMRFKILVSGDRSIGLLLVCKNA
jgi:hypothetical protein